MHRLPPKNPKIVPKKWVMCFWAEQSYIVLRPKRIFCSRIIVRVPTLSMNGACAAEIKEENHVSH